MSTLVKTGKRLKGQIEQHRKAELTHPPRCDTNRQIPEINATVRIVCHYHDSNSVAEGVVSA